MIYIYIFTISEKIQDIQNEVNNLKENNVYLELSNRNLNNAVTNLKYEIVTMKHENADIKRKNTELTLSLDSLKKPNCNDKTNDLITKVIKENNNDIQNTLSALSNTIYDLKIGYTKLESRVNNGLNLSRSSGHRRLLSPPGNVNL